MVKSQHLYRFPNEHDRYFTELFYEQHVHHGGVGNKDIETLLLRDHFIPIRLPEGSFPFRYIKRYLIARKWISELKPYSILFCQLPVHAFMVRWMIRQLANKKIRVFILVADFDGLRDGNLKLLKQELQLLKHATGIIVHSEAMKAWLRTKLYEQPISILGPFDFLATVYHGNRIRTMSCCFAGNLYKSSFVNQLNTIKGIDFYIYGDGWDPGINKNLAVHYYGSKDPYTLPQTILGSFGLIWDGSSISSSHEPIASYQQYNSPHKLSLYILAGMPVIAPAFSAAGSFVKENSIGWVVNDLQELPCLLESITDDMYSQAIAKMGFWQERICSGKQLPAALEELIRLSASEPD